MELVVRVNGLNIHQSVERGALLRIEAVAVAAGVECGGALVRRQLAQGAEAAANGIALIWRKRGEVLRGCAHLVTLLWGKFLHLFIALDDAVALGCRHGIELRQTVMHALLRGLRQIVEAGLVLQRLVLLREAEIAVRVHPLGKVLTVVGVGAGGIGRVGGFAAFNRRACCRPSAVGSVAGS